MKSSLAAAIVLAATLCVSNVFACGCVNLLPVSDYQCQRDVLDCAWIVEKEESTVCDYVDSNLIYGTDEDFQLCVR